MRADLPRQLGPLPAMAIMVGIIIGSGIFRTPPVIAQHTDSAVYMLLLWVLGGAISLCGALTWAELGAMFPRSGGIYVFLREGLGDCPAFVFGWTYMLITKPLAAAAIAVIFAEHFNILFAGLLAANFGGPLDTRWLTCTLLTALTVVNTPGVRVGGGVAVALTALKVGALVAIVVLGFTLGAGQTAHFTVTPLGAGAVTGLATMLGAVLWTYDGWSDVGAIAGEVRAPQKNLPRVFLLGTAAVTLLYVAVNATYVWMLPMEQLRTADSVAPLIMQRLLGPWGETAVTAIVVLSTLGSTHGSILTGARITFAQARDGLLFRPLAAIHPRWQTPHVSLWFQWCLSCLAVWAVPNFQGLADGFVFTMWIFYGLAGIAVFTLRHTRPDAERPYRCWGYPWVPAAFVASSIGMTVLSIWQARTQPATSGPDPLVWLAVLLAGVPVYWVWRRLHRPVVDAAD